MTVIQKRWELHNLKAQKLLIWGLKHGLITPYNDNLIKKLRTIYDGGIPASILLLSDGMTNGYCYDRALLMAKAFLDEDVDVKLLYASINSLKYNPQFINDNPLYADHCLVLIKREKKQYIIDTSQGFIYDKNFYWLIEHPKIRKINNKESIINYVIEEETHYPENIERDKYIAPIVLPMIELTYNNPNEMYATLGIELLQKEIQYFKEKINYEELCQEIKNDMTRLGLLKK